MERLIDERRSQYKKSYEDARRKREDIQVQIRRSSREQELMKKRGTELPGIPAAYSGGVSREEILDHLQSVSGSEQIDTNEWNQNVMGVFSGKYELELEATEHFRKILSIQKNPPIQSVIDAKVVPKFVEFLTRENQSELQFEAAWVLTNIASGTTKQTQAVVESGAIPLFVNLLSSSSEDLREQAVWALGNIAGDCIGYRDLVISAGTLQPLLYLIAKSEKKSLLRNATWVVSNLCRGKPHPGPEVAHPALSAFKVLINETDPEILVDTCWALSYISDGPSDYVAAVIKSDVCPRVIQLLSTEQLQLRTPALRTIGNIVTGTDEQTQYIIDCGAIPVLKQLLNTSVRALKKEACWAISNITAGNPAQIEQVISNGLIQPLIQLLVTDDFDVRKEAAWAISNAISGGNASQIDYLVTAGCIKPLCGLLNVDDPKIVMVTLEAIENIFKFGKTKQEMHRLDANPFCDMFESDQGVANLEALQEHKLYEISDKAWNIIYTYFPCEDDNMGAIDDATPLMEFNFKGGFNFQQ